MKRSLASEQGRRTDEYASARDFCAIFLRDMRSLYLLALTLTGDAATAKESLLAAFDECRNTTSVFKPWAQSWSRLRVIDQAIRAVRTRARRGSVAAEQEDTLVVPAELSAVLELDDFHRFVYVLTVLESYSVRDAAILLKRGRWEIASAQTEALQAVSGALNPVSEIVATALPASLSA